MKKEMSKEEFRNFARRIYPLITGMQELAKEYGVEGVDLRADEDGYFNLHIIDNDHWSLVQLADGSPRIEYDFVEYLDAEVNA